MPHAAASDQSAVTHRLPRRHFASLTDFLASEPNRVALYRGPDRGGAAGRPIRR